MIEVQNLSKRYGSHLAVDDVSFQVKDGEILGFLGPNGAGKSTTMNILTGYLSATAGSVKIDGYDILENANEAKRRIGYLPEQPPLYLDMTVKEYLNFIFGLKKVKLPKEPHIQEVCRLVKIQEVMGRLIKNLSKGYRQRVGIAQALIGNPDVLILDEPTVGLDPKQIIEIRSLIKHLGRSHTVILSSHILSEIQAVCDRIIVINRGVMIADDTPDNLARTLSSDRSLIARVRGPKSDVQRLLNGIPGVRKVSFLGPREGNASEFSIEPEGEADVRPYIFDRLADRHWTLLMLRPNEMDLEQIFLRLTDSTLDPHEVAKRTHAVPAAEEPAAPQAEEEAAPASEGWQAVDKQPEETGADAASGTEAAPADTATEKEGE